ncbi:MerR family transcriptional regulator [Croceibacterium mercuriale]
MHLKIGDLANATGTKVETVRYYERIGLLPEPERTSSNYRSYSSGHLDRLNFIRHARGLGFDIADIRSLLGLADEPEGDCTEVDRIASGHLEAVERKISRLIVLRDELTRMIGQCRGGQVGSCRIMNVLADHSLCKGEHSAS